jgi:hypothetical protein
VVPRPASATDAVRTATLAETVLRVVPSRVVTRVVPVREDSAVVRLVTTAGEFTVSKWVLGNRC